MSPHLLSVCVAPRGGSSKSEEQDELRKKLAYLVDLKTISVVDLSSGSELLHLEHDARVDWLELNETGKLLPPRPRAA
jgi:intraflagellar transport protein 172